MTYVQKHLANIKIKYKNEIQQKTHFTYKEIKNLKYR